MQTEKRVVDPFTIEVVKDGLTAVGDEMFETLLRTSMSPIIYEVLDFASGLTDAKGRLVTQGQGVTGFIGMLTTSVEAVLEKWSGRLEPGDIVITNDPYTGGGSHLSDVSLVAPIFIDGELLAFAASKAHWTEVGGMSPGSFTTDSTEIYQEGLQFPNVKIWSRGERNDSLVELIASNVRTPEQTIGDLMAQAAAMRVGERAFREVCDKYGTDVVLETIDALIVHGETIARLELGKLPKGTFEAVDYIDDDGLGGGPFEVRVKVTITDDEFVCDFTGSHPQVPGPVNNTFTGLLSAAQVAFKAVTSPGAAANHGSFAPLRVICPSGTILSCERPAPCSIYWEALTFGAELIWRALAPHLPDRLGAGHMASVVGTIVAGPHADTGDFVVLVEPEAGGWGANPSADGNVGQFCCLDGETFVTQAEIAEARFGLRVERYSLDPLGAGAGRMRGGPGCIREYRILRDGWIVTSTAGRHAFPVWGLHGGEDGTTNHVDVVKPDGTITRFGKVARHPLAEGDLVRIVTATGGGYGQPLERAPESVADDVRNGYVTFEQARRDYGVEVDASTYEVVGLPGR
jgi:N-methylhydantoinase B